MNESELNVNAGLTSDSQSFMPPRASFRNVSASRDDAVSSYVRMKLLELEATRPKGWQKEFAAVARIAPSSVAQVKKGTGVGARTAAGFAKALGFKSANDLRSAAYKWWETEGRLASVGPEPAVKSPTPVMGEAVDAVLVLYPATGREQLEGILERFGHPHFATRDRGWWIQVLLDELRLDEHAVLEARQASRSRPTTSRPPRKRV